MDRIPIVDVSRLDNKKEISESTIGELRIPTELAGQICEQVRNGNGISLCAIGEERPNGFHLLGVSIEFRPGLREPAAPPMGDKSEEPEPKPVHVADTSEPVQVPNVPFVELPAN